MQVQQHRLLAALTCLPVASTLHRLYRAPQLLVSRSHRLYIDYVVHREYSSLGCTGSTAPMSCICTRCLAARLLDGRSHWLSQCARSLLLAARLLVSRLHRLYFSYAVRGDYSSSGRTGSTSATPCTATTRFTATPALPRLLHAPSRHHLLLALALLRLCCPSGRMVSRSACLSH
jgi:hypothetical protein